MLSWPKAVSLWNKNQTFSSNYYAMPKKNSDSYQEVKDLITKKKGTRSLFAMNISKPKEEPKVEPKIEPKEEPKVEPKVEPKEEPKVEPNINRNRQQTEREKEKFNKDRFINPFNKTIENIKYYGQIENWKRLKPQEKKDLYRNIYDLDFLIKELPSLGKNPYPSSESLPLKELREGYKKYLVEQGIEPKEEPKVEIDKDFEKKLDLSIKYEKDFQKELVMKFLSKINDKPSLERSNEQKSRTQIKVPFSRITSQILTIKELQEYDEKILPQLKKSNEKINDYEEKKKNLEKAPKQESRESEVISKPQEEKIEDWRTKLNYKRVDPETLKDLAKKGEGRVDLISYLPIDKNYKLGFQYLKSKYQNVYTNIVQKVKDTVDDKVNLGTMTPKQRKDYFRIPLSGKDLEEFFDDLAFFDPAILATIHFKEVGYTDRQRNREKKRRSFTRFQEFMG